MDERVKNGGIAGGIAFLIMAAIGIFAPVEVIEKIPVGLESALTVIIATGFAYLKPRSAGLEPS